MISDTTPSSATQIDELRRRLNQAMVGKADVVEMVIACILAGGHLLIDDLPGLGKTTLSKALANSIGAKFARVQCCLLYTSDAADE